MKNFKMTAEGRAILLAEMIAEDVKKSIEVNAGEVIIKDNQVYIYDKTDSEWYELTAKAIDYSEVSNEIRDEFNLCRNSRGL